MPFPLLAEGGLAALASFAVDLNEAPENQRLRSLWAAHLDEPFPADVDKAEDAGADLVMLDADIAGVISTVLGSRRPPDATQQQTLRACLVELDRLEVVAAGAALL